MPPLPITSPILLLYYMYGSYCFKPPTNFTCPDLARESCRKSYTCSLAGHGLYLVLAFLVHALHTLPSPTATLGGVAPTALVFAKQLAVSRQV